MGGRGEVGRKCGHGNGPSPSQVASLPPGILLLHCRGTTTIVVATGGHCAFSNLQFSLLCLLPYSSLALSMIGLRPNMFFLAMVVLVSIIKQNT